MVKFWVGVVSENHVKRGVTGGFCQVCHGKGGPLKRMKKAITYSTTVLKLILILIKNCRLSQL